MNNTQLYSFIETSFFMRRLEEIASLDVLIAIQNDLLRKPDRWPVIPGTGGARKGRVADPGSARGKSGSFRYLYLYLEHRGRIYLLFLFAKKDQGNLNQEQKRSIAQIIRQIKEAVDETSEYKTGKNE